jgi:hypothetical protein
MTVASFVTNIPVFYQTQRPSPFTTEKHPEQSQFTLKSIPLKSSTPKQLQPHQSLLSSIPYKNLAFISMYIDYTILDLFALYLVQYS